MLKKDYDFINGIISDDKHFVVAYPNTSGKVDDDDKIIPYLVKVFALPKNVLNDIEFSKRINNYVARFELANLEADVVNLANRIAKYESMDDVNQKSLNKANEKLEILLNALSDYKALLTTSDIFDFDGSVFGEISLNERFTEVVGTVLTTRISYATAIYHNIFTKLCEAYRDGINKDNREAFVEAINKLLHTYYSEEEDDTFKNMKVKINNEEFKYLVELCHENLKWDDKGIRYESSGKKEEAYNRWYDKKKTMVLKQVFLFVFRQCFNFDLQANIIRKIGATV